MEQAAFQIVVADLAQALPRPPVTAAQLRIYERELADLPADVLVPAIRILMRTSEFFPTIKAIRETCAELTLGLPSEAEALTQIEARVRWAQRGADPPPPEVHPTVKEALDHVGGFHAFKTTDNPGVMRGQFLRLYRDLRAGAVLEHQVGAIELPAGPQRKEITRGVAE